MDQRGRLKFYKELYFFEWQRKETLFSSTSALPSTLAFVLGGVVVYHVNNLPSENGIGAFCFWATSDRRSE